MAYRGQKPGVWVFLLLLVVVLVAAWLTRWRYEGTQIRVNRFNGEKQMRVRYDSGEHEWVPVMNPHEQFE